VLLFALNLIQRYRYFFEFFWIVAQPPATQSCIMKVVGLVSGGKDSCFNLMQCMKYGHEIVALANLRPSGSYGISSLLFVQVESRCSLRNAISDPISPKCFLLDEMDSYMYQTVGYQLIDALAECLALPLVQRCITGEPKLQSMSYVVTGWYRVRGIVCWLI
jgi:diphthine-ammonia ligase